MQDQFGFSGLRNLRSDIQAELARLAEPPLTVGNAAATAVPVVSRSDGAWKRFSVIAGIIAVIVLVIWISDHGSGNTGYSTTGTVQAGDTAQDAAASPPTPAPEAAPVPTPTPTITESQPAIGIGAQLSANEIAYCFAEKVRLEAAQPLLNAAADADIAAYNSRINDYNSRCSNFRYMPADRDAAQAYVDANRSALVEAGQSSVHASPVVGADQTPAVQDPVQGATQ